MKYRFVQVTRTGVWVSPGVFDDPFETMAANVIRGHVVGQPRAAVSADDDRVIFALDGAGHVIRPEAFRVDASKVA